ncbi:oligosaccharide flippase family protein [Robertkochia aurantiaca]|uniref:oligosaccharide flippase family protein n=1 Tax=Robertkochia aurantiaca TaxID=2873700 RepID=UPI001CCCF5CC|nr:oligosaccharide flippase family protein [Robertkochia sp. 3YJGBD-33]
MGIVIKQSARNLILTYIGFAIGAVNTLFLYTNFLSAAYFGLIGFLLSAANILMPFLSFGIHNTIVKFYSSYENEEEKHRFITTSLLMPLLLIIPVALIGFVGYDEISSFLSSKNDIVEDYVWYIFFLAIAMAYFEIFFALAKVKYRTVYGNFLKEVFHRALIAVLLFGVYLNWLSVPHFVAAMTLVYILRGLLMLLAIWRNGDLSLSFALPPDFKRVVKYAFLIIVAGSVAVVLLDIDKVMLGKFKSIENIAYYNVAVFIAVVIAVPARALHQITYPLTSTLMNQGKMDELSDLYKRSSINLLIVSGLVFLLILGNIKELYALIPEQYAGGIPVVFLIALAKLSDNLLGINNAIIFNSNYYRMVLFFGVLLAILTVILNIIFIPVWGIEGAAFATLLAFLIYNISKIIFVKTKLKMQPFTKNTLKTFLLLGALLPAFYFMSLPFLPVISIMIKSAAMAAFYGVAVIWLNLSEDIHGLFLKYVKRKGPRL